MKKILVLSTFMFFFACGAFAQAQKIAFVNTQIIIDTLPAKDTAEKKLAIFAKQYDQRIKDLQAEIQSKQKEYEVKVKGGATQAQLELIQKSYERLVQEYQETEQAGQQDMQAQRGLLLKPIVEDIKKAIGVVAAAKGYSNVIDNATGMVLWSANTNDDITAAVIKHMTAPKK